MRIKLLYPPDVPSNAFQQETIVPPLGLASITSTLRKNGFNVSQDDLGVKIEQDSKLSNMVKAELCNLPLLPDLDKNVVDSRTEVVADKILKKTSYKGYDLVGLSVISPSQMASALILAKRIREKTGAEIVIGGGIMNDVCRDLLTKYDFIRYVMTYEGELSILRLCEELSSKNMDIQTVPNLVYRENKEIRSNEWRTYLINELPVPDFDGLPLDLYVENAKRMCLRHSLDVVRPANLIIPYQISKGCLYNCAFCGCAGSHFHYKDANKVFDELKILRQRYDCFFMFKNNLINFDKKYLNNFSDLVIGDRLDISWTDSAVLNLLDESLLQKMYKAGCKELIFGLESGSTPVLRKMGKCFDLFNAEKILKHSSQAGIWNSTHIMLGFPGETKADLNKTSAFVKANMKYIDMLQVHAFNLHTGTSVYKNPTTFKIKALSSKSSHIPFESNLILGFDEIDGLSWQKKKEQITEYEQEIHDIFHKKYVPAELVSYLYATFSTKEQIKEYLSTDK